MKLRNSIFLLLPLLALASTNPSGEVNADPAGADEAIAWDSERNLSQDDADDDLSDIDPALLEPYEVPDLGEGLPSIEEWSKYPADVDLTEEEDLPSVEKRGLHRKHRSHHRKKPHRNRKPHHPSRRKHHKHRKPKQASHHHKHKKHPHKHKKHQHKHKKHPHKHKKHPHRHNKHSHKHKKHPHKHKKHHHKHKNNLILGAPFHKPTGLEPHRAPHPQHRKHIHPINPHRTPKLYHSKSLPHVLACTKPSSWGGCHTWFRPFDVCLNLPDRLDNKLSTFRPGEGAYHCIVYAGKGCRNGRRRIKFPGPLDLTYADNKISSYRCVRMCRLPGFGHDPLGTGGKVWC